MSQQTMTTNGYFGLGLFRFLRDLKTHNERRWFEANKQRYKADVQAPFLRLITDLAPALKEIGGGFIADPSPNGGSMMRYLSRHTVFERQEPLQDARRGALLARQGQRRGRSGIFPSSGTTQLRNRRRNLAARAQGAQKNSRQDRRRSHRVGPSDHGCGPWLNMPHGRRIAEAAASRLRPGSPVYRRHQAQGLTALTDQEVTGDDFLDLVLHRLRAT